MKPIVVVLVSQISGDQVVTVATKAFEKVTDLKVSEKFVATKFKDFVIPVPPRVTNIPIPPLDILPKGVVIIDPI